MSTTLPEKVPTISLRVRRYRWCTDAMMRWIRVGAAGMVVASAVAGPAVVQPAGQGRNSATIECLWYEDRHGRFVFKYPGKDWMVTESGGAYVVGLTHTSNVTIALYDKASWGGLPLPTDLARFDPPRPGGAIGMAPFLFQVHRAVANQGDRRREVLTLREPGPEGSLREVRYLMTVPGGERHWLVCRLDGTPQAVNRAFECGLMAATLEVRRPGGAPPAGPRPASAPPETVTESPRRERGDGPQYSKAILAVVDHGRVAISGEIDVDGSTANCRLTESSHSMLNSGALGAVRGSKFRPMTVRGVPVVSSFTSWLRVGAE